MIAVEMHVVEWIGRERQNFTKIETKLDIVPDKALFEVFINDMGHEVGRNSCGWNHSVGWWAQP